jgi:hypothetical protein
MRIGFISASFFAVVCYCVVIVSGCSYVSAKGTGADPADFKIENADAADMINHFRNKKVKIDDDTWLNGKDKKVVKAQFDPSVLLLAARPGYDHQFILAAFTKTTRGRGENAPTMLLKIFKMRTGVGPLTGEEYYVPVKETLCPEPSDCSTD